MRMGMRTRMRMGMRMRMRMRMRIMEGLHAPSTAPTHGDAVTHPPMVPKPKANLVLRGQMLSAHGTI